MQKYKYIFVEKLGGENIYVFTYIYTNYFCKYTQEADNMGSSRKRK